MTTLDIEIAVMRYLGVRQNIVVPNVSWGIQSLHECDLLMLSPNGYATEIEIKISKSDILADKKKRHGHKHNHIKYLFFAVPEILKDYALKHIPERSGLYIVKKDIKWKGWDYCVTEKKAERNKNCHQWTLQERANLGRLGTMRILGLNETIQQINQEIRQINKETK